MKSSSFATQRICAAKKVCSKALRASRVPYRLAFVVPIAGGRMTVISRSNAEHYTWPSAIGADLCDGWHLHRTEALSIIEERMPPGSAEQRHLHQRAMQFFYVLAGELVIELDGQEHRLMPSTGLTIPTQTPHQVFNRSSEDARFLVISQPPSHGDRIPADRGLQTT
jgi:mannose-6-phosphate isomerase-like protein (cupin superfamily)